MRIVIAVSFFIIFFSGVTLAVLFNFEDFLFIFPVEVCLSYFLREVEVDE